MSWQVVSTVLMIVFALVLVQAVLADPFIQITNDLNDTGDYSSLEGVDGYNGNSVIGGLMEDWFHMGLIGIFGTMAWGAWWVVRREMSRGGL